MILISLFYATLLFGYDADLSLKSLRDASTEKVAVSTSSPQVYVLFQKDCHACRKQVLDLSCLDQVAEVTLVGGFSSQQDLRREYRSYSSPYRGVYGGRDFLEAFQITQYLTPQIIVLTQNLNKKMIGLQSCKNILKIIKKESQI